MLHRIDENSLADIEFRMKWKSAEGVHTDASLIMVNCWRDMLPASVYEQLTGAGPGEQKTFRFAPGELIEKHNEKHQYRIRRDRFDEKRAVPAFGRFYPRGILGGFYNVFPQNVAPVRCAGVDARSVDVDFNHPLAGYEIELTAAVHSVTDKPFDRGGQCKELSETVASDGPGMQARYKGIPTDFSAPGAFARDDETDDTRFYEKPRLVTHIDDRAIETISGLYGEFLSPEMRVLDLMSSWRSHVPENARPKEMIGLGMNAREMEDNPQLTDFVIHDLNEKPQLPFADNTFDRIICTVSVEYMTRPLEIFIESARILKPGGVLIHTFSNRWFPPKVIRLWTELHEFEHMGLVMDYFLRTEKFTDLATFSSRGWDRPETDRYWPDMPQSDPVFAVWGTCRK
ncbi:MAG: methyltransferase domain-containing protein [Desulfobacterales bacterium]|nr:methyltransferase domain-containing protein [Desulfobacterales bacterium]